MTLERGTAISVKEWFVWQSRPLGQKHNAKLALVNPAGEKKSLMKIAVKAVNYDGE
jgi:hypothetical protein